MAGVQEAVYKGQTIYISSHSGLQDDEVVQNQERLLEMMKSAGGTDLLSLSDMSGVVISPEVNTELKRIGNELLKFSKKAAVVGMGTGAKKAIIQSFMIIARKPMKLFDTVEEAKEWLVAD